MTELPWQEARRVAHASAAPLPAGDVPLAEALGTTLAAPLSALAPLPAFDAAAMDGYAVAGTQPWTLLGSVLAGQRGAGALRPGEAVEVATGAAVPEGTEGVLPYESACRTADGVTGRIEAGRHVRRRGEDYHRGDELLGSGVAVTPTVLGLAASAGYDTLWVRRSPQVAVLVTGDELTDTGLPGEGRVRDAIGPLLPGLVRAYGGATERVGRLPDDSDALLGALTDLASVDVVAICGASSKGPADHLRHVLAGLGAEVLVDGVACRPGHPQLLARAQGSFIVGLPGNPYAAVGAVLTLLAPLLAGLAGWRMRPPERAGLDGDVWAHPADTRLVAVRRCRDRAEPVGHDRPSLLWGAALADALAVVPPGWRGGEVELLPLPARCG